MLSDDIQRKMTNIERESAQNTALTLCIALSYGSQQEIIAAVKTTAQQFKDEKISLEDITPDFFSKQLYTKDIPNPDILIRTSGEQRISNYLLWQLAYAEFFFTNTLWPDFGKEELLDIIKNFNNRERRYGKN